MALQMDTIYVVLRKVARYALHRPSVRLSVRRLAARQSRTQGSNVVHMF